MPKRPRKTASKSKSKTTALATIREDAVSHKFSTIAHEATKNSTTHEKYLSEIQKLFKDVDEVQIKAILVKNTKAYFRLGEDNPQVISYMDFVAMFLNSLEQEQQMTFNMTHRGNPDGCEMHPLMRYIFSFCIQISNVSSFAVRRLALQFINIILNKMGDGSLEDDLFDELSTCMLERMQDTHYKVRVEAIHAAKRLQDPRDSSDSISKAFRFHLKYDPAASVRKAVMECIGYSSLNSEHILQRTIDCDEAVRTAAYERLSEVPLKHIKLRKRQEILFRAFKEKSVKITKFIDNVLIPLWIDQSEKSMINLFDTVRYDLKLENKMQYDIVAEKIMLSLYKERSIMELLNDLKLNNDTRLIPVSEIKIHSLVYWRQLANCINTAGEDLDIVLPDLLPFVDLMIQHDSFKGDIMNMPSLDQNTILDQLEYNSTRLELFRMLHLFDTSEEVSRNKLKDYLLKVLLHDKHLNKFHIREIVVLLKHFYIKFSDWQQDILNIVTDIYEPVVTPSNTEPNLPTASTEKSHETEMRKATLKFEMISLSTDRETALSEKDYAKAQECDEKLAVLKSQLDKLHASSIILPPVEDVHFEEEIREVTKDAKDIIKSLTILHYMLSEFDYRLTPELRIIQKDVIHPQMSSENPEIEYWAFKCAACICLEDLGLAQKYFPLFFIKMFAEISVAHNDFNIADLALQIIFDLFTKFSMVDFPMETSKEQCSSRHRRLFSKDSSGDVSISEDSVRSDGFIQIAIKLLQECEVASTRLIVVKGLAKLFLNNKIVSDKLLGMLLLMYHHPEMDLEENNEIRQYIVMMLYEIGAGAGGGPESLIHALIPAIKIRTEAPANSPLLQIDLYNISKLVLAITAAISDEDLHNLLAMTVCSELKRMSRNEELELVLTKTLANCHIKHDEQLKQDVKSYVEQILPTVAGKQARRYLKQTLSNIERGDEEQGSMMTEGSATQVSEREVSDRMEVIEEGNENLDPNVGGV